MLRHVKALSTFILSSVRLLSLASTTGVIFHKKHDNDGGSWKGKLRKFANEKRNQKENSITTEMTFSWNFNSIHYRLVDSMFGKFPPTNFLSCPWNLRFCLHFHSITSIKLAAVIAPSVPYFFWNIVWTLRHQLGQNCHNRKKIATSAPVSRVRKSENFLSRFHGDSSCLRNFPNVCLCWSEKIFSDFTLLTISSNF